MNQVNSVLSKVCNTRQHSYLNNPMIASNMFTPTHYLEKAALKKSLAWTIVDLTELIPGEGMSFFDSVLGAIENLINTCNLEMSYITHLENLNVIKNGKICNMLEIVDIITEEVINEMEKYEDLLSSGTSPQLIKEEVKKFQNINLVMAAISNVLKIAITIVPNIEKIPIFLYFPVQTHVIEFPIFIALSEERLFHTLKNDPLKEKKKKQHCRCGVNDKIKRRRCLLPRCPCYQEKRNCNSNCHCKGCENNKTVVSKLTSPRKRIRPALSKINLQNSFVYAQHVIDDLKSEKIAPAQHYLLEACITILMSEMKATYNEVNDQLVINLLIKKYGTFIQNIKDNPSSDKEICKSLKWIEKESIAKWVKRRRKTFMLMHTMT